MKKKNLTKCIILSIVTLGIYTLFWGTDLVFETDKLQKKPPSIFLRILCSVVTGGLYLVYWANKTGKAMESKTNRFQTRPIIYTILMFMILATDYAFVITVVKNLTLTIGIPFILLIVLISLVQHDINVLIENGKLK